jgi:hypothetical protein
MVEEEEEKVRALLPLRLILLMKVEGKGKGQDLDLLCEQARGKEEEDKGTDPDGEVNETIGEGAHTDGMNEQKEAAATAEDDGEIDPWVLMLVVLVVALELVRGASAEAKGKYPPPKDHVIQRRTMRRNGGWWLMPRPRLLGVGAREGRGGGKRVKK